MMSDLVNTVLGDNDDDAEKLEETSSYDQNQMKLYEDEALYPLLECINFISEESIKQFVRAVLLEAPAVFWTQPASTVEGQSPPDEMLEGGLVLRVQRVARTSLYIANTQQVGQYEQDLMVAAALIHAVTRYVPTETSSYQDPMYPYTADNFVHQVRYEYANERDAYMTGENDDSEILNRSTPLDIEEDDLMTVLRLVRCHRGYLSPVPETVPVTTLEWGFHLAYYIACNLHYIVDGPNVSEQRWLNH